METRLVKQDQIREEQRKRTERDKKAKLQSVADARKRQQILKHRQQDDEDLDFVNRAPTDVDPVVLVKQRVNPTLQQPRP